MTSLYPPVYPEGLRVWHSSLQTAMRGTPFDELRIHVKLPALCLVAADRRELFRQKCSDVDEVVGNKFLRGADAFVAKQRTTSRGFFGCFENRNVVSMCLMWAMRDDHLYSKFLDLRLYRCPHFRNMLPQMRVWKIQNPKIAHSELARPLPCFSFSDARWRAGADLALGHYERIYALAFLRKLQQRAGSSELDIVRMSADDEYAIGLRVLR